VQLTENSKFKIDWVTDTEKFNFLMSVMMTVEGALLRFCWSDRKILPEILIPQLYEYVYRKSYTDFYEIGIG
jgi:hypothetical protein